MYDKTDILQSMFWLIKPFNPYQWPASNFSLQNHPLIQHKGFENRK